ncbi:adenylate/guanylate cyclase domain-containing protein [Bradyrhizobium sp. CIAT3101]|uniref:adenylate/guanylate cyclase domain-containing protein n=1 Tax=Bradyrhizobium sp. CIAT3101 TaxID=439387 RepID=UPI0024B1C27E|nr:adenylate/guanylate cyclase domain-containing protein [Bradyrhizobium sp. CIAT3101]WFU79220.1 adenylate/guanylate cyclase domain-containing protein [Bradyrhizobium sp. CIAT3101]
MLIELGRGPSAEVARSRSIERELDRSSSSTTSEGRTLPKIGSADRKGIFGASVSRRHRRRMLALEGGDGCDTHPILRDLHSEGGTDYAMFLVDFSPTTFVADAALSIATDRAGGFQEVDLASFRDLVSVLGLAIYRLILLREPPLKMLDCYLGHMSGARVLAAEIVRGQGRIISAAIMLADLSGFTTLTDREDPMELVQWLNEHLEAVGDPVIENDGEILKFSGDGLLAVFPAENAAGQP